MGTNDVFANLVNKRLIGVDTWKNLVFDYLRNAFIEFIAQVYDRDGTFASSKLLISASGNDEFDIDNGVGNDGIGHLLETGDDYEKDVRFQNTNSTVYYVGLKYSERPDGVQINARTGLPEYRGFREVIGESDVPTEVTDNSGTIIVNINSICQSPAITDAGRKCLVWMVTPAAGATSEAIAIEECTVQWDGSKNWIETVGALGQTSISEVESNYRILMLGPTVRSNVDLSAESGYWFIGTVTGGGAGSPLSSTDNSGQRLIEHSLSDVVDFPNNPNVFTRIQTFAPTPAEIAIVATGGVNCAAITAYGGSGSSNGIEATGTLTGAGGVFSASAGDGITVTSSTRVAGRFTGGTGLGFPAISVTAQGDNVGGAFSGSGSGAGISASGGSTGAGGSFWSGGSGGNGINAQSIGGNGKGGNFSGYGSGAGVAATGGSTGSGGDFTGGPSSGAGITATAQGGNSNGVVATGFGSEAGIKATGGATGYGGEFHGGSSSGYGLYAKSHGGNSSGLYSEGVGSGDGVSGVGGVTGKGGHFYGGTTSGDGLMSNALGGDSNGLVSVGHNNGSGVDCTGGATGNGITARGGVTSGVGVFGISYVAGYAGGAFIGGGVGIEVTGGSNYAAIRITARSGDPSSLTNGDIWFDGTNFKCRVGGVTKTFTIT